MKRSIAHRLAQIVIFGGAARKPPDREAPSTPGNFAVSARTATTFTLTWDASTDNVGVVAYEVEYRTTGHGHGPYTWWATVTGLTTTITGLTEATSYNIRVRAKDAAGNQSGFATLTNEVTADETAPTVPGNLTVSARTATTLVLTWDASTDNVGVTGYEVEYRLTGIGSYVWWATTASLTTTITGLTEITGYDIRVRAVDAAGNQSGFATLVNEVTADVTAPSVPGNLAASSITATTLTLTWDPSTDNVGVTEYEVQQRLASGVNGDYVTIATVAAPTVTLAVTGLTGDTQYRFRVRAKDAAGNASAWGPDNDGLLVLTSWAFVAPSTNNGLIIAFIEDGAGGWYIGGSFTSITDSVATYTTGYTRLVRLKPDGTIDAGFSCPVNGTIRAFALDATGLYIAGSFSGANSVGTSTRNYLARVRPFNDPAPGAVDAWNPNSNSIIRDIALDSAAGKLYVGGDFSTIAGVSRRRLARLGTLATATLDAWRPDPSANIYSMALDAVNGKLYIGGDFTSIGGTGADINPSQPRNRLARLTASVFATLDAWRPDANFNVERVLFDSVNNKLYVGGHFTSIGGLGTDINPSQTRNRIARITAEPIGFAIATLDGWNPDVTGPTGSRVLSMALDTAGGFLYLGGDFTTVGGTGRNRIARVSSGATATLDAWNPDVVFQSLSSGSASVQRILIYPIPDKAIIVGSFDSIANHVDTSGNDIAGLDI